MEPGTRVEVRSHYDDSWARGFEIAEVVDDKRYRVRRLSDGMVLPLDFTDDDIRRERRSGLWWY
jgi:hypothetical protein